MYEQAAKGEFRKPRHTHYVSTSNGVTHPAMTNLPGYEDDNMADWRPATAAEIERYKAGNDTAAPQVTGGVLDLREQPAPVQATVHSLRLQDDDPVVTDAPDPAQAQQAAADALAAAQAAPPTIDPTDPPQLPPGAIPMTPPPAFKVD